MNFWPKCLVLMIYNNINLLRPFPHGAFQPHNNPNETMRVGNILLRA